MGNTIGRIFRVTTFGESHGGGVGAVIDGCPAGLPLSESDIQVALDRRRPGTNRLVSPRKERDRVRIASGVFEGHTLGTPIALLIENEDARPSAYVHLRDLYRPGHADYTYEMRYGRRNWQGGGRASARETVARVAAGAVAAKLLGFEWNVEVIAWVDSIGDVAIPDALETPSRGEVDASIVRSPHPESSEAMVRLIEEARKEGDSVGGTIAVAARGVPPGWGEPVFGKLEADIAGALMSIPAARGVEVGLGFAGTRLRGSLHNDCFIHDGSRIRTRTNHSGGIQGGISNGEEIRFRVAFKPVSTLFREQETVTREGKATTVRASGRHDPCVLPRAVPIVESMMALVLVDHALATQAHARVKNKASLPQ